MSDTATVSMGKDLSPLQAAVEELVSALKQTPHGASVRVQVRGLRQDNGQPIDPVMPLAVKELLERFPTKLRAVKWEALDGMETAVGAEAAAYVSIMRTPDLHRSFEREYLEQMGSHRQILDANNAADLDSDLTPDFIDPIKPQVDVITTE